MHIVPKIAVGIIVAFVIYPFAVFGIALRVSTRSAQTRHFLSGLVAAAEIGCFPWVGPPAR